MRKGTTLRRFPAHEIRFGVPMPASKAKVVDAIASFGERGAYTEEVHAKLHPARACNPKTVHACISAINDMLIESDVRIRCGDDGRYHIVGAEA
jgi:hypothetical protein